MTVQTRPMPPPPRPSADELVARHGPLVWALCRRLDPRPEDAYQEVWEKLLRNVGRFDPAGPASMKTWLTTVTHRHLIDRHRRRATRGEVVPIEGAPPSPGHGAADLDRLRGVQRLEAAVAELPEPHRRVVILHHVHELPLDEIAAVEGVAIGTIKSRLHRARARLAIRLGGAAGSEP
jgi:RNA polymerase sigma-70 factor, ECF subfamily